MTALRTVAIVGFGKAGGSLAASLTGAGLTVHVVSRRQERRDIAAGAVGGSVFRSLSALLDSDAYSVLDAIFLAVPDDDITSVVGEFTRVSTHPPILAHLSGARGREAITDIVDIKGASAFHPLAALDGRRPIPSQTLIAVDGTDATATPLVALASKIDGLPARIRAGEHARYHAGAAMAGNLPVALVADGIALLQQAGVAEESARLALARLLESTAKALQRGSLPDMVTGPIARGDATTVRRHLEILEDPAVAERYRLLSRALIAVAPLAEDAAAELEATITASGPGAHGPMDHSA